VDWLAGAFRHFAPVAVAAPAKAAADVADDHENIRAFILIAHDNLHLCIMEPTAQNCAATQMRELETVGRSLSTR